MIPLLCLSFACQPFFDLVADQAEGKDILPFLRTDLPHAVPSIINAGQLGLPGCQR
jgi:hypothetical protein